MERRDPEGLKGRKGAVKTAWALAAGVLLVFLLSTLAGAQEVRLDPALEREALEIEKLLRCPVCVGQTVAESQTEVSQKIKTEIRRMLAEGKTRDEILNYYVAQYTEWILMMPPRRGFGLFVWVLPVLIFIAGGIWLWSFLSRHRSSRVAEAGETGPVQEAQAREDEAFSRVYERLKRDYL